MSLTHRGHEQRREAIVAALHLTEAEADAAIRSATVRATSSDEVIVNQGETAEAMFVITRGRFEVDVVGVSGATRAVQMLGPGSVFGETGLLENAPRTASVVSRAEGEVLMFTADAARAVLAGDEQAAYQVAVESQRRHEQVYRAATE